MHYLRKWIRNIFGFSGNEVNGFLILIPLMLVLVFSEPVYRAMIVRGDRRYPKDNRKLDSLVAFWQVQNQDLNKLPVRQEITLFPFDPNHAPVADLQQLGLSELLAKRIAAYRAKGGVFRVKSDLMKIYGLDSALYQQLYRYISLPSRRLVNPHQEKARYTHDSRTTGQPSERADFDINTADTTALKRVYGIGSTLAARILKFRDGLGGFVALEQLYEVYGLDSTVVQRLLEDCFIESDFVPEKININTADAQILSRHPYIRHRLSRLLVNYRFQHGDFTEVNDIKKLSVLKPEESGRLLPYLKVKD